MPRGQKQQVIYKQKQRGQGYLAQSLIKFSVKGYCKFAVYHKHLAGHVLVLLNQCGEPLMAWHDKLAIHPFRSFKMQHSAHFKNVLKKHKPTTIYLNDGTHIETYLRSYQSLITSYEHESLMQILDTVRCEALATFQTRQDKNISFNAALALDSTITLTEYNRIWGEVK
jgi:hypothetical protein